MKLIQLAFNVHERKMQDLPYTKQSRYVTKIPIPTLFLKKSWHKFHSLVKNVRLEVFPDWRLQIETSDFRLFC